MAWSAAVSCSARCMRRKLADAEDQKRELLEDGWPADAGVNYFNRK